MKKYGIVEFEDHSLAIVPRIWLSNDLKFCKWPPKNAEEHCKNCDVPKKKWKNHGIIKIRGYSSKYLSVYKFSLHL